MILEKLTEDADSRSFLACKLRSFFAMSLFSIIVILSVMLILQLGLILNYSNLLVY